MRKVTSQQPERPARSATPETVVSLLAAAGLRAERVDRCPEPTCPLCARGSRAAA